MKTVEFKGKTYDSTQAMELLEELSKKFDTVRLMYEGQEWYANVTYYKRGTCGHHAIGDNPFDALCRLIEQAKGKGHGF